MFKLIVTLNNQPQIVGQFTSYKRALDTAYGFWADHIWHITGPGKRWNDTEEPTLAESMRRKLFDQQYLR